MYKSSPQSRRTLLHIETVRSPFKPADEMIPGSLKTFLQWKEASERWKLITYRTTYQLNLLIILLNTPVKDYNHLLSLVFCGHLLPQHDNMIWESGLPGRLNSGQKKHLYIVDCKLPHTQHKALCIKVRQIQSVQRKLDICSTFVTLWTCSCDCSTASIQSFNWGDKTSKCVALSWDDRGRQ